MAVVRRPRICPHLYLPDLFEPLLCLRCEELPQKKQSLSQCNRQSCQNVPEETRSNSHLRHRHSHHRKFSSHRHSQRSPKTHISLWCLGLGWLLYSGIIKFQENILETGNYASFMPYISFFLCAGLDLNVLNQYNYCPIYYAANFNYLHQEENAPAALL